MPETEIIYQYSPESFSGTELDYAVEICEAVMDVWQSDAAEEDDRQPAGTVEMASANSLCRPDRVVRAHCRDRDSLILSLHPHNDRGTAVAATESASWPAPTGSRARCSATASAPAMSM
jgi:2-isopropylmalate synthase